MSTEEIMETALTLKKKLSEAVQEASPIFLHDPGVVLVKITCPYEELFDQLLKGG